MAQWMGFHPDLYKWLVWGLYFAALCHGGLIITEYNMSGESQGLGKNIEGLLFDIQGIRANIDQFYNDIPG